MITIDTNDEHLYCIGDIHYKINSLVKILKKLKRNSTVVCVGDIGLGFPRNITGCCEDDGDILSEINHIGYMKDLNIILLRGNHDNPDVWDRDNKPKHDNLIFIKDVEHLKFRDKNIMLIGGAVSVDRELRIIGRDYWLNECVSPTAKEQVAFKLFNNDDCLNCEFDYMISHTAGTSAPPATLGSGIVERFAQHDPSLIANLLDERELVEECFRMTKAKRNIYGHFHHSIDEEVEGIRYTCLNELELLELSKEFTD